MGGSQGHDRDGEGILEAAAPPKPAPPALLCPEPCPPSPSPQDKCEPPVYVSDRRLVKAVALMQVCVRGGGEGRP